MQRNSQKVSAQAFVKETISQWLEHNAFRLSAALAYYTVFSLGPLILLSVAFAGIFFGQNAAKGELVGQLRGLFGQPGAAAIQSFVASLNRPHHNFAASLISVGVLLFGATGVFSELNSALNEIWDVRPKTSTGIMGFFKNRLLSFAMVLAIGFLLLVSLILSAVLAAASDKISDLMKMPPFFFHAVTFAGSFAVITLLFAMIFKILPNVPILWRDVWIGAVATSLLFTIGKTAIGFYLGKSTVASAYGASSSVMIILLWAYYSSLILFLGAEFTEVFARRFGSRCLKTAEEKAA